MFLRGFSLICPLVLGPPSHYSWTANHLRRKITVPLVPKTRRFQNWIEIGIITKINHKHVEIKLKWHASPFVFYLHHLEWKNTHARSCFRGSSELHQSNTLSPIPVTSVAVLSSVSGGGGASLGAPWWRTVTVFSPQRASPRPPLQHEGLKEEMGDAGGTRRGQRTPLRKKSVASSVASVYRRHVENGRMVANVFTA